MSQAEGWTFTGESVSVAAEEALTLVEEASFTIVDHRGDAVGYPAAGVFVGDTRICSRLVLTIAGQQVEPLASYAPTPYEAMFMGRVPTDPPLVVIRRLWAGRGLRADVQLRNYGPLELAVTVRYAVEGDFADLFAVKEGRARGEPTGSRPLNGGLWLGGDDDRRAAIVRPHPGAAIEGGRTGTITWEATVPARGEWSACLELAAVRAGQEIVPRHRCGEEPAASVPATRQRRWLERIPSLETNIVGLGQAFERAAEDLGALRIFDPHHPDEPVVAAGAPWFMTLFGRDSILTSMMALPLDPGLGLNIARTLARLQGRTWVKETEEEPGRILHEIRLGDGASLSLSDGYVYYGTVDATPLFVMLVGELWRWGVPFDELEPLLPAVDAALGWMVGPGDPDGDGYLEYERHTATGLVNQGWKDSADGVSFASGELPQPPIAVAEAQAYAYAAWLASADLAEAAGATTSAEERRVRADALRIAFNRDFWLSDPGVIALALDGEKRPVDAVASNMGHCLWTGIVDADRAGGVAACLAGPELFSGWGVRTLAPAMARYHPLSYHNGSVWPHDTAIAVAGLRRAGFPEEAMRVATGLLRAAVERDGRLPELFSGLGADEIATPVAYPASCSPQAWASASPLLLLRALLGLEPHVPHGRLELDPLMPRASDHLRLDGMPLGGTEIAIEVEGDTVAVQGVPSVLTVVHRAASAGPG
ncbi:MAG: amylo-alpha-1,6-glucosidase [Acidimicrobiales bacterium]